MSQCGETIKARTGLLDNYSLLILLVLLELARCP